MQVKISKRLYRAEITYFKINIICFLQVDCMWRNSLLINVHVQTIKRKLSNSNGKTFKFHFSCLFFFFSYLLGIAASEAQNLTTLSSTKMKGEEIATRTSTSLSHSKRVLLLSSSPPLKTVKTLRSIRKFKYARHLR